MSIASLESYLEENYATFKESASVVAQSDKRAKNLISSDHKLYNFDKISEAIYSTNSKSCSVDGLRVNDGFLEFIEFKTGFLRRLTRENWTPEIGTCDYKKGICDEYWKLYWKLDKKEREELIDSIKDKAIESFITYEKHIFLRLSEHDRIPLRLIAVIDGNSIRAHVETHIVAVVVGAEDTRDDMLAGVLLHVVEAALPVNHDRYSFPNFHRILANVENNAVFFMYVRHGDAVQGAVVGRLAAALGIKSGAVENHTISAVNLLARENLGGKLTQIGVLIVKLFGFHVETSFRAENSLYI